MSRLSKDFKSAPSLEEQKSAKLQTVAQTALLIAAYILEDTGKIIAGIKDLEIQSISINGMPGFSLNAAPSETFDQFWTALLKTPINNKVNAQYNEDEKAIWFSSLEDVQHFVRDYIYHYSGPNILQYQSPSPIRPTEKMTDKDTLLFSHFGYAGKEGFEAAFLRLQQYAQTNPLIGFTFKVEDMDLAFNLVDYTQSGQTKYPTTHVLRFH